MTEKQKLHHYIGIEMNRQSWILLGREDRNNQDNTRMVNFAKISLYHWQKSPKYKPINEQRGTWLISHVYAVMGDGRSALDYAQETWRLTEKYKFKDFDLAYAFEAMARAHAALINKAEPTAAKLIFVTVINPESGICNSAIKIFASTLLSSSPTISDRI